MYGPSVDAYDATLVYTQRMKLFAGCPKHVHEQIYNQEDLGLSHRHLFNVIMSKSMERLS